MFTPESKTQAESAASNAPSSRNTFIPREKLFEKRGILDPLGESTNPLTNDEYKDIYKDQTMKNGDAMTYMKQAALWSGAPMYKVRNEVITKIYDNQVVLIVSGTGSGKTVLTPKFALHALNYEGRIAITNPKIIPTETNARQSAQNLDVEIGSAVGIKYRESNKNWISDDTKLTYCTDGLVLAKIRKDPMLSEYDCVIIDEAHERGLNIDLLLMLLKDLVKTRPDFKLIIMSATINENIFIDYFNDSSIRFAKVNASGEPNYPIKEEFSETPRVKRKADGDVDDDYGEYAEEAAKMVIDVLRKTHSGERGDVLVFVGGNKEASKGAMLVNAEFKRNQSSSSESSSSSQMGGESIQNLDDANVTDDEIRVYCDALSSKTPNHTKDMLVDGTGKYMMNGKYNRKVIFATNLAESSITVNGVDHVIDSGVEHISKFYPETNMHCMERKTISKASHLQRMGRTGRTKPGTCYNLFTKDEYERIFHDFAESSIYLSDISEFVLSFLTSDQVDYAHLSFTYNDDVIKNEPSSLSCYLNRLIERPHEIAVRACIQQFMLMGALAPHGEGDEGRVSATPKGHAMSAFMLKPNLASMIVDAYYAGQRCLDDMLTVSALLNHAELKMGQYFVGWPQVRSKDKALKGKRDRDPAVLKARARYDGVLRKMAHQSGDVVTLFRIYREFQEQQRRHRDKNTQSTDSESDQVDGAEVDGAEVDGFRSGGAMDLDFSVGGDESGAEGAVAVPNELKAWCGAKHLRFTEFSRVASKRRQLSQRWGVALRRNREALDAAKPRVAWDADRDADRDADADTDRLLLALATSNMHNYVKANGSTMQYGKRVSTYQTCATLESITAPLDDNNREVTTFAHFIGGGKDEGICMKLMSIFGKKKVMAFNVLPPAVRALLSSEPRYLAVMDTPVKADNSRDRRDTSRRRSPRPWRRDTRRTQRRRGRRNNDDDDRTTRATPRALRRSEGKWWQKIGKGTGRNGGAVYTRQQRDRTRGSRYASRLRRSPTPRGTARRSRRVSVRKRPRRARRSRASRSKRR